MRNKIKDKNNASNELKSIPPSKKLKMLLELETFINNIAIKKEISVVSHRQTRSQKECLTKRVVPKELNQSRKQESYI